MTTVSGAGGLTPQPISGDARGSALTAVRPPGGFAVTRFSPGQVGALVPSSSDTLRAQAAPSPQAAPASPATVPPPRGRLLDMLV
jgi:hypothetical protein